MVSCPTCTKNLEWYLLYTHSELELRIQCGNYCLSVGYFLSFFLQNKIERIRIVLKITLIHLATTFNRVLNHNTMNVHYAIKNVICKQKSINITNSHLLTFIRISSISLRTYRPRGAFSIIFRYSY